MGCREQLVVQKIVSDPEMVATFTGIHKELQFRFKNNYFSPIKNSTVVEGFRRNLPFTIKFQQLEVIGKA